MGRALPLLEPPLKHVCGVNLNHFNYGALTSLREAPLSNLQFNSIQFNCLNCEWRHSVNHVRSSLGATGLFVLRILMLKQNRLVALDRCSTSTVIVRSSASQGLVELASSCLAIVALCSTSTTGSRRSLSPRSRFTTSGF